MYSLIAGSNKAVDARLTLKFSRIELIVHNGLLVSTGLRAYALQLIYIYFLYLFVGIFIHVVILAFYRWFCWSSICDIFTVALDSPKRWNGMRLRRMNHGWWDMADCRGGGGGWGHTELMNSDCRNWTRSCGRQRSRGMGMVGVGYKAAARAVVVVVIVVVVSELAKTSFLMSQRIEAAPIKCAGGESARLP